jgi:hypothetical protein
MSVVGVNRIGRYVLLGHGMTRVNSYIDEAKELSVYLLKMIDYGIFRHVTQSNPRISSCLATLSALKIIEKAGEGYKILDERVIEAAKHNIPAT